jgi:PAS domain-containing protein
MRLIEQDLLSAIWKHQALIITDFQNLAPQLSEVQIQNASGGCTESVFNLLSLLALSLVHSQYTLDRLLNDCMYRLKKGSAIESGPFRLLQLEEIPGLIVIDDNVEITEYLPALLKAHSVVLAIKDRSARIEWMNMAFAQLANSPRENLLRKRSSDIWDNRFGQQIVTHDLVVSQTGQMIVMDELLHIGEAIRRQIAIRFPFRYNNGNVLRTAVIALAVPEHRLVYESV